MAFMLHWELGLSIPFALLLGVDDAVLNAGLMGYNGVLCAIALGDKTWKGGAWATVAVLLSVLLQIGGMKWGNNNPHRTVRCCCMDSGRVQGRMEK